MPERLAVFGDVHANLAAMRAVVDAIADMGITAGACTGDLVMRGGDPDGCVALMRRLGWPCVAGNTDHKVATRQARPKGDPKAQRVGSRAWTTNELSKENLAFVAALPMVARVSLKKWTVALVHGAPDDPRQAVDEHTPEKEVAKLISALDGPDCIVSGHTHRPFVRQVRGCLLVNPGSVGEALDGDLHPRWGWLEARRSGLVAHLERVPRKIAMVRGPH